jgi:hypothetical protein
VRPTGMLRGSRPHTLSWAMSRLLMAAPYFSAIDSRSRSGKFWVSRHRCAKSDSSSASFSGVPEVVVDARRLVGVHRVPIEVLRPR